MSFRPVPRKTAFTRASASYRGQRKIEGKVSLMSNMFHWHEILNKVTSIGGKRVETCYMSAKGDQSLIPSIIRRSTSNVKEIKKRSKEGFQDPWWSCEGGTFKWSITATSKLEKGKCTPTWWREIRIEKLNNPQKNYAPSSLGLLGESTNPRGCRS